MLVALGALPILPLRRRWAGARRPAPSGRCASSGRCSESKADTSTLWRELENYNLVFTYHESTRCSASGSAGPSSEHIKLPDVTGSYELEPYVPHNSVVGLWAFGGLLGFSLLWAIFPVGFFFTARAYRWASTPMERVTALGAAAVQICYLIQGYADLGFGSWGPVFTVATSYALVGKICVANGAWGPAPHERGSRAGPGPHAGARAGPGLISRPTEARARSPGQEGHGNPPRATTARPRRPTVNRFRGQ